MSPLGEFVARREESIGAPERVAGSRPSASRALWTAQESIMAWRAAHRKVHSTAWHQAITARHGITMRVTNVMWHGVAVGCGVWHTGTRKSTRRFAEALALATRGGHLEASTHNSVLGLPDCLATRWDPSGQLPCLATWPLGLLDARVRGFLAALPPGLAASPDRPCSS